MYIRMSGKRKDAEIRGALVGKKTTIPPDLLMWHLAGLLGVRYVPYTKPDPRFKKVWRTPRVSDSVPFCERLYRLPDPRG